MVIVWIFGGGCMTVTVKFFASLRETTGLSEKIVEANEASAQTVADLWSLTTDNLDLPPNTLVAINMDYVELDHKVRDGDEVAFFPPVTGG